MNPIWLPASLFGGFFQAWRTALQQRLRAELSVSGAGLVRYLYGLPCALAFAAIWLTIRHDAVPPERALQVLEAVRRRLETRHNTDQPYGDWGMMCAYPPFKHRADTHSKSSFAFRYHNGSDWPWLDGVYAEERLRRGLPGWRYPMVRWWEICLEKGWMGAVEYFSPPWGRGSLLQGWSAMPAAVALKYRDAVLKGDAD